MNNKYAYATAITNDSYIPCIILNKRIMDYLKCKYPFIVLIAGEVTEQGIKQMEDFGIIVQKTELFSLHNRNSKHKYASFHFSPISLIEYDLLMIFEADVVLLNNIEDKFDFYYSQLTLSQHDFLFHPSNLLEYNCKKNKVFQDFETFVFFCKPNINNYNKIIQLHNYKINNKTNIVSDHDIMRVLFYHNINYEIKILKSLKQFHFVGIPKIWNSLNQIKVIKTIFYDYNLKIDYIYNFLINNTTKIKQLFIYDYTSFIKNFYLLEEKYELFF